MFWIVRLISLLPSLLMGAAEMAVSTSPPAAIAAIAASPATLLPFLAMVIPTIALAMVAIVLTWAVVAKD